MTCSVLLKTIHFWKYCNPFNNVSPKVIMNMKNHQKMIKPKDSSNILKFPVRKSFRMTENKELCNILLLYVCGVHFSIRTNRYKWDIDLSLSLSLIWMLTWSWWCRLERWFTLSLFLCLCLSLSLFLDANLVMVVQTGTSVFLGMASTSISSCM